MTPVEKTVEPMSPNDVAIIVSELSVLQYFPSDKDARTAIAKDLVDICPNLTEARWLSRRMRQLFNEWPGPRELRAVYCSRNKPRDGLEVISRTYPEGVPTPPPGSELAWYGAIAAPEQKALPAGHVATRDVLIDRNIQVLGNLKDINRPRRRLPSPEPTNPNYTPVTQADIDEAVEENRNARALRELEPEA